MNYLVLYFGKFGTTENTALTIKQKIGPACTVVKLVKNKLIDLSEYDSIIIGMAVYSGRIPKIVKKFTDRHQSNLMNKKLFLYIHCLDSDDVTLNRLKETIGTRLYDYAKEKQVLGGRIKLSEHNFVIRKIFQSKGRKQGINFENYDTTSENTILRFADNVINATESSV